MTGPYGRRERPEPPPPLGVPTVDAHTHLDACGCVDADDVRAALDRAQAWYTSAKYKEITPIRDKAAKFRGFIVEGVN